MSKEIINQNGTLFKQRTTPDWQEGYQQGLEGGKHDLNRIVALKEDLAYEKGLLAGFTKSIVLIRHLQRTYNNMECEQEILKEAMELIAEKIEPNNNE
jgi:hypothetical protein